MISLKNFKLSSILKKGTIGTTDFFDIRKVWFILLIIFLILNLLLALYNVYLFSRIKKMELFTAQVSPVTNTETIDRSQLSEMIKYYEEKKIRHIRIKEHPNIVGDPANIPTLQNSDENSTPSATF